MIISFSGASGRTDAGQAALLTVHALVASGNAATLLRLVEPAEAHSDPLTLGVPCADLPIGKASSTAERFVGALREAEQAGSHVVVDLPVPLLRMPSVRQAVHLPILAVGPYRTDERAAAVLGADLDAAPSTDGCGAEHARREMNPTVPPWYLGCRRPGGTSAASAFATAMNDASSMSCVRTLPVTVAGLSRSEMDAVENGKPGPRSLRIGALLVLALRSVAENAFAARVPPPGSEAASEAERLRLTEDRRSFVERLRDLADDLDALAAGPGPSPAELADAPVLYGWARDVVPTPILRGMVSGHPGIADGRHVRTSELVVTDNATWARTLSRLYALREPEAAGTTRTLQ